jgi:inosine-uridine nucleoside N-ribohydrolase
MIDKISWGPITIIITGSHTNLAIFLMKNPHLKGNIKRIYIMGGGVRSKNLSGCCPQNATSSCTPQQCGDPGNLFTDYTSNPYAEFNMFADPFASYQVMQFLGHANANNQSLCLCIIYDSLDKLK